jgi:alkaline phosphatase
MDDAVKAAFALTDPRETLIIVTADHSHTMSMGGYPGRGADVRG